MLGVFDVEQGFINLGEEIDQINEQVASLVLGLDAKGQSSDYHKKMRNARTPMQDHFVGKKGEFIVRNWINQNTDCTCSDPDTTIYKPWQKDWAADLKVTGGIYQDEPLHCKTCSRKTYSFCNDFSWTFQWANKSGGGGRDDLFVEKNPEALCAFMYIDSMYDERGFVRAILPWRMVELLLRDPIADSLKGLKLCLYWKDIKNLVNKEFNHGRLEETLVAGSV